MGQMKWPSALASLDHHPGLQGKEGGLTEHKEHGACMAADLGTGSIDMSGGMDPCEDWLTRVLGTMRSHRRPSPRRGDMLNCIWKVSLGHWVGTSCRRVRGKLGDRATSERGGWLEEVQRHGCPRWDGRGQSLCRSSEQA